MDPEVHGVGHHQLGLVHLIENAGLGFGGAVCQKDILAISVGRRQNRLEVFKYSQLYGLGCAAVEILMVFTFPEKGVARLAVETIERDIVLAKGFNMFGGKIITHHSNQTRLRKMTGHHSEVGS